jgi:autotransporter adhesin
MNRTYRSVGNEALGGGAAASEIRSARRHGVRRAGMTAAVLLLLANAVSAQVKIGDNPVTINPGSLLELESTDLGVSMPRIAVTDRVTWGLRGNVPVEGMMVYNTNPTTGVNGLQAGMAVWKNGQWVSVDETPYMHVNSTQVGNSTLANSGATGANAIAVGPNAIASGAESTALGQGATATAAQGVAIGAGSSVVQVGGVALGAGSVASTAAGVAGYVPPGASAAQTAAVIGTTSTQAAVSVGDAATGQFRQITGVAAGSVDSDAVNVSQLKAVQTSVTNIDNSAVKYENNADGSVNYNSVTLGNNASNGPVTVHNVAAGVAGTDAVNVNQLNATAGSLNNRINNLADQVSSNTKMLSGGIAASAAMAVVTPVEPGRYHVSGAVAGYNGQAGIGFNVLKRSDNGQTTLHAGVGWGSGGSKAIVRVGFGFSFD